MSRTIRLLASTVTAVLLASTVVLGVVVGSARSMAAAAERPNIVFVLTDDMSNRDVQYLAGLRNVMANNGTTFQRAYVSDAVCCPSRASILRGQYPHNHGVEGNIAPSGHDAFRDLGRESSTIATWLHDEGGYRTALIGKYMNDYNQRYIPPGWDYWFATHGAAKYRKYNDNGTLVDYPNNSPSTDRLANKAYAYLERTKDDPRPFFLYLSTEDPHSPATPPARYKGTFSDEPLPKPPSFNERDVSDKPSWVRQRPLLSAYKIDGMRTHHRERLESLRAVGEMVGNLVATLKAQGKMRNTYIVFTSDNGFHLGQHRMTPGKRTAYEEDIRVPLMVRGPGVPAGRTLKHQVLNNDLAPTFARLAGVTPPAFVDGKSMVPLLGTSPPTVSNWRTGILTENWRTDAVGGMSDAPTYKALRTKNFSWVRYVNGERELYDMRDDPYQLNSRDPSNNRSLVRRYNNRLEKLATCDGAECRAAETN